MEPLTSVIIVIVAITITNPTAVETAIELQRWKPLTGVIIVMVPITITSPTPVDTAIELQR